MPKRSRSGVVSRPARVVAPTSVNGGRSSVTTLRPRPLADGDRQLAVLHRRIERLLERAVEAVDLVDEEHAARLERGQQRGDVALALERRAGGLHERHVELGGDDLRERRLAEPRRPGEQDVVERLAARRRRPGARRRAARLQRRPGRRTRPGARPQRAVELVLAVERARRLDPRRPPSVMPAASPRRPQRARRAAPRRVSPVGAVEQLVGLGGREAELEQAVAGAARAGRRRA